MSQDPNDRQERVVSITAGSPLENLCHLYIHRKILRGAWSWRGTGSAVLYRDRYLITAGHNVYQDKSSIRSVEIRCGATDARSAPIHETISGWQALDARRYQPQGWRRRMPFPHDYGVIRLNTAKSVQTPFELIDEVVAGSQVDFAGYPGGKHDGWTLHHAAATLDTPRRSLVNYDLTTYKSNSGGPVWIMAGNTPKLAAVHVSVSQGRVVDAEFADEVHRLMGVLDQRAAERGLA